jgi:hypothetical protein
MIASTGISHFGMIRLMRSGWPVLGLQASGIPILDFILHDIEIRFFTTPCLERFTGTFEDISIITNLQY